MSARASLALEYHRRGFAVIPIKAGEKHPPLVDWKQYQTRRPTEEEIRRWFSDGNRNLAVITGKVSGVSVIDLDGPQGAESFKALGIPSDTFTVKTPKGMHLYFKYTPELHTGAGFLPGVDVRNDGGYVLGSGSVVAGRKYEVVRNVPMLSLASVPVALKRNGKLPQTAHPAPTIRDDPGWVSNLLANGSRQGARNTDAARLAGYFRSKGHPPDVVEAILRPFAERCSPPMDMAELRGVVASTARYPVEAERIENAPVEGDVLTAKAPEFPKEIVSGGALADYLAGVSPLTQAPDAYHVLNFLTVVGCALGRNVWVDMPEAIYPNLYALLIGQTATSKKSTSVRLARRLLREIAPEVVILPGVVSTEAIYDALAVQPGTRALIVFDEFRALFSIGKRQSTGDLIPKLGSLYYCPDYDAINRREPGKESRRTTEVHDVFVSVIGCSPSGWLEGEVTSGHIAGGFVNRFCTVSGVGKAPIPVPPPLDEGRWSRLVASLKVVAAHWQANPSRIALDAEARGLYERYYVQVDAERRKQDDRTTEITARVDEHVLKVALILAALENSHSISKVAMARALLFGDYLRTVALTVFGNITGSAVGRIEAKVIERLNAYGGRVQKRRLQNSLRGVTRDAGEFNRAWRNLVEAGRVTERMPTGTREVWAVLA